MNKEIKEIFVLKPSPSLDDSSASTKPELVVQVGHSSNVNCLAFSPDGRWLASAGDDYAVTIWDVDSGYKLRNLFVKLGHIESVVFSPDGRLLAVGSRYGVRIWNPETGHELGILEAQSNDYRENV